MIRTWLTSLALLRHPEVLSDLGQRRLHAVQIRRLREAFPTAKISSDIRLSEVTLGSIRLGEHTCLSEGTVVSLGDSLNGFGQLEVGDHTWIGQYNNIRAGGGVVRIGSDCLISQFCTLAATNHGFKKTQRIRTQAPAGNSTNITVHDDVWLGAGVVVTAGVVIGQGAVVGANAVVVRDIPAYEIWAGVPARKIGERS